MHVRQRFLDRFTKPDVQVALHLGGQSGLDANLGGAVVPGFLGPADNLIHRKEVALLLPEVTAESAEAATLDAHVGEVDVSVDHVGDDVSHGPPAEFVGSHDQGVIFLARSAKQHNCFVRRDIFPR